MMTVLVTALFAPQSQAATVYAELAGGVAQFHNNAPFFGPGTDSSGLGYAIDLGAYVSFTGSGSPIEFQAGLQEKLSLGSAGGTSYSVLTVYPTARVQITR